MGSANLRRRLWVPLLGLCLALVAAGASAAQTCKYDSIPATAPASRFTDNGDGTVTDKTTGLQWKRCSEGQTWSGGTCTGSRTFHTWQAALQLAEGASYAGKGDWRLPNIKELNSIVEQACYEPSIDLAVFPGTPLNSFWSSSPYTANTSSVLVVAFSGGYDSQNNRDGNSNGPVRLVRGGQDSGPLNDTGIDWWANGTTNFLSSPPADYPGQDASYGRDATQDNDADGHAGFAFTKVAANGGALAASASAWSCVRDNVTGLIWEVKTDDGGPRDQDWTYSWYNPDPATNGGFAGYPDYGNNCYDSTRCDTAKFAADVNQAGLCGASDWRLPTREELRSIVDYSRYSPAIDIAWFPNTPSSWYWSSSPGAYSTDSAWFVYFAYGSDGYGYPKYNDYQVRLVRGGQALPFVPPPVTTLGPSGGPSNPSGSAAEPVNTATGNYYYQHTDLTLPGLGLGLAFTRTYNAQDATDGPFGRGWTHSYQTRLTENGDGSVVIRHGDGHESFYDPNGDGSYRSRYPGVHDRLVKPSATSFLLTGKDQTRHAFTNGYLTQISDRNGNALGLGYDGAGHLTSITDSAGRIVTLSYDANGRLLQLTAPLGRTVRYAYDANGDLVTDTDPEGGVMRYSYNGDRRLTRITNRRGQILIDNVYDGSGRVISQTNGRGLVTGFAWDSPNPGDTTITNPLGEASIHRHDGQRRLIAEINPLGHSVQYAYDASNNRVQVTDRNGQVTAYSYDAGAMS